MDCSKIAAYEFKQWPAVKIQRLSNKVARTIALHPSKFKLSRAKQDCSASASLAFSL